MAAATLSGSYGLTSSAALHSCDAPANRDRISTPGSFLRGDIFLGNEIHTVTQGGHELNTRGTIKPGKSRMAVGMVDVTDRRPVRLTKGAISLIQMDRIFPRSL